MFQADKPTQLILFWNFATANLCQMKIWEMMRQTAYDVPFLMTVLTLQCGFFYFFCDQSITSNLKPLSRLE